MKRAVDWAIRQKGLHPYEKLLLMTMCNSAKKVTGLQTVPLDHVMNIGLTPEQLNSAMYCLEDKELVIDHRFIDDENGVFVGFWLTPEAIDFQIHGEREPKFKIEGVPTRRRTISSSTKLAVLKKDGYQCVQCGSRNDLCIDHIYPLAKGGSNDYSNLQTLCRRCNSAKGAKLFDEGVFA